jgi:protein involved in polysaccharide export with SLBB domain
VLLLAGFATCGFAQSAGEIEASTTSVGPDEHFHLSAGDVIEIKFFYNSELNETVQIRPDGHISMPLIGDVDLNGKTVEQTTTYLDKTYQKYLKTPSITLQVKSYASQKVYVGGEVPRPGAISLASKLTVMDALMEAGGPRHTGNNSTVVLLRKNERGTASIYKVSLKTKGKEPSPASTTVLVPFDVVLVPETRVARVDRWVDQNLRQMVPAIMTAGFSYLQNATVLPQ